MIQRFYQLLLLLSPREFRERFGEELLQTARSVRRDRPSLTDQCRAAVDAVTTVAALHADFRAEARMEARQLASTTRNSPMDSLLRDIRFAARGLVRTPSFTIFVVLTLALGIGANAAMFGIADRLLIRGPEQVRDADQLARLFLTSRPKGQNEFTTSYFGHVEFDVLKNSTNVIDGISQYAINEVIEGRGIDAQPSQVGYAAAKFFPLLGVQPVLGRFFSEAEDAPNAAQHVVVLSHGIWQTRFGGRADALGKSLFLNDEPYTIVGVAPRGFTGAGLGRVDYWTPASIYGVRVTDDWTRAWNAQWLFGVVRIKPGVTRDQVAREFTAAHRRAYTGDDKAYAEANLFVGDLGASSDGRQSADVRVLRWLSGVAVLVLLIACANVANLLIARGVRRGREMAIRSALGANRIRLIRLLLLESLMLSVGGALIGTGFAYLVGSLARASVFTYVDWSTSPVDVRVLVASTIIAVLTGMVIGLIPAWKISRPNLAGALKSGVREGGGRRSHVRSSLTVVQAALSVTLLIGAGLFVKSLWQVRSIHLGIDADRVLTLSVNRSNLARISDSTERAAERVRRREFLANALPDLAAVPGVQHVAVAVGMPFGNRFSVKLRIPGIDSLPRLSTGGASLSAVSGDYFATVGTQILRGRGFTSADRAGSERVAIVNATMAQTMWPKSDPIGQCIKPFNDSIPCARIVGIAENTRRNQLREEPTMHYYIPLGQEIGIGGSSLLVRGADDPHVLLPAVRKALQRLDASIQYINATSIQEQIDPQTRPWRLGAAVFAMSGILALLVAAVGIYSVISYLIADRQREIGVRIALGAQTVDISTLVLRGSLIMAVFGVVIGELLALSASKFVEPMLFDTSARDLSVYATVGVLLIAVAFLATALPALRAGRIDPLDALRTE